MRTLITLLLFALTSSANAQDLVVTGGRIFDSVSDELRPNTGVAIRGGRIVGVDVAPSPDATRVVALDDDQVLMPGIVDLHAHYNITVMDRPRQDETRYYSVVMLANGVTTTFPCGEYNPREMLDMRRRIDRGEQIGPRVLSSGPYYGLGMRRRAGAEEVYAQVDEWAELGARGFKAKSANPVQLQALIERAHAHGISVTAHMDSGFRNSVNPKDAILMGIDRVEHFLGGDLLSPERSAYASLQELTDEDLESPEFKEIVDLFVSHGVWFDATLTAYGYDSVEDDIYDQWTNEAQYLAPEIQAWAAETEPRRYPQFAKIFWVKLKTIKRFYDAGGRITLGTDHVSTGRYLQGFSAHREMHAMSKAGIPNAAILKIATTNGARAMNVGDRRGTIEIGKDADMIIIDGDPLTDIRNTRNVRTVIKGGVVYDAAELLESVVGKVGTLEE